MAECPSGDVAHLRSEPIDTLDLTPRVLNALRRVSIFTVGDLVHAVESGQLRSIRNIGAKSEELIKERIAGIKAEPGLFRTLRLTAPQSTGVRPCDSDRELNRLIRGIAERLADAVARQLKRELLHPSALLDTQTSVSGLLEASRSAPTIRTCEYMAALLASPNACWEMSVLVRKCSPRALRVLSLRRGLRRLTLDGVGSELSVTRERVRQIARRAEQRIVDATRACVRGDATLWPTMSLVRIQSALLFAEGMGDGLAYSAWADSIKSSGLLGAFEKTAAHGELDAAELLVVVASIAEKALQDEDFHPIRLPQNLLDAARFAAEGRPDLPVGLGRSVANLPPDTRKLIERHARYTCGVSARWLAREIGLDVEQTEGILCALGYERVADGWFALSPESSDYHVSSQSVFHKAVRKMSQFCGPLSPADICGGLRLAVSRTNFPVPPPIVMGKLLERHFYKSEEGLFYWDGHVRATLSRAERIIAECLRRCSVVSHSTLVEGFLLGGLSLAALSATLQVSPIFDRVDSGLYRLRGTRISGDAIAEAQRASERIRTDLDVQYRAAGSIRVAVTVNAAMIASGTIVSNLLPNLDGHWECAVGSEDGPQITVREGTIGRLQRVYAALSCVPGDRLALVFDTWTRKVSVARADT